MSNWNLPSESDANAWLASAWIESVVGVLEVMTGQRPEFDVRPGARPDDTVLWWEQKLDLSADTAIWVGAEQAAWLEMGRRSLEIAGVDDGSEEDFRGTYQELLQQALSTFSQSIGAKLGREVNCLEGQTIRTGPPEDPVRFEIAYPDAEPAALYLVFAGELPDADAPVAAQPPAESTASPQTGSSMIPVAPKAPTLTAELLLDVELPVSISFGRAHLPLRDVLKLASGSIVELNRSVSEPVEVIINNCVIARGEVVVVDGNYGVRISQIISRQERLRTLN